MNRRIELLFSDIEVGCEEFGFIPRYKAKSRAGVPYEADDEDCSYAAHVRSKTGDPSWAVVEGILFQRGA